MTEFEWCGIKFVLAHCGGGVLREVIPMHCHSASSYELHFITAGEGTLLTDHGEYKMRSGNFFVTGPGVNHSQIPDENNPAEDVFIYIQKKSASAGSGAAARFLNTHFFFTQQFETDAAQEILAEQRGNKPGREYAQAGLLINLLTRITRLYVPSGGEPFSGGENLNDMRFLIIENMFLYENDFTLKQLSDRLGICERQTQRLLKKYYGKTFREKKKESMR